MITKELLLKAIDQAGDECEGGCTMMKAASDPEVTTKMRDDMKRTALAGLAEGYDPIDTVYFNALHVGYKLRQLEESEQLDPTKVN